MNQKISRLIFCIFFLLCFQTFSFSRQIKNLLVSFSKQRILLLFPYGKEELLYYYDLTTKEKGVVLKGGFREIYWGSSEKNIIYVQIKKKINKYYSTLYSLDLDSKKRKVIWNTRDNLILGPHYSPEGKYIGLVLFNFFSLDSRLSILKKEENKAKSFRLLKSVSLPLLHNYSWFWIGEEDIIYYTRESGICSLYSYNVPKNKSKIIISNIPKPLGKIQKMGPYKKLFWITKLKNESNGHSNFKGVILNLADKKLKMIDIPIPQQFSAMKAIVSPDGDKVILKGCKRKDKASLYLLKLNILSFKNLLPTLPSSCTINWLNEKEIIYWDSKDNTLKSINVNNLKTRILVSMEAEI